MRYVDYPKQAIGSIFTTEKIPSVDLRKFCACGKGAPSKSVLTPFPNCFTAPFNNMQTLKFKAQPTNAFFATVNQMFGGSSQLPTTVERAVIKSLSTV